jgi:hypothetical protein
MVPDNSQGTPSKSTSKGAKKGAKDGKKGQKRRPQRVATITSHNDDDKEADGSDQECVVAAEHDFKCQA